MLNKKVFVALVVVSLLVLGLPAIVAAQSADDQAWSSSITYYTPSDTEGNLQVSYYEEGSNVPINANPITLNPHAAGSLLIGSTTIPGMPDSFSGSAVLSSDVPVVATYVQLASGAGSSYPRPLYTGFTPTDAANKFYVPTFLVNRFNTNTSMGIQNVEATQITADVKLYAVGSVTPAYTKNVTIEAQSTVLLRGSDFGMPLGTVFNGSVVIENATGKVVASAIEYSTVARDAKAFEGVAQGATKVYMASMMCNVFGGQNTNYAVQNAGTVSTVVNVYYYDTNGNSVGTGQHTIQAGNKASVNACADGVPEGTTGSAVIQSDGQPLLVVGKVNSPSSTATAFVGQSAGSLNIAAPYIRWATDNVTNGGWRSYIAVMNVGTGSATNIVATYYDATGSVAGTDILASVGSPLGVAIKANTTAESAGALVDGNFGIGGGAVEITSDQPIVVVVRVSKALFGLYDLNKFAEDYNGVAIPAN